MTKLLIKIDFPLSTSEEQNIADALRQALAIRFNQNIVCVEVVHHKIKQKKDTKK